MKKVVGYVLLGLLGIVIIRWVIGVVFSRPKKERIQVQTEEATVSREGEKLGDQEAWLQVVVFEDEDGNRMRGLGENGLDWKVYYQVGEGEIKSVEARLNRKCFPSIFNWMYGGCSEQVKVPIGEWVRVFLESREGWKMTRGEVVMKTKAGKNMVYLGARRLKPGEVVEDDKVVDCRRLVVKKKVSEGQTLRLVVGVEADGKTEGLRYRVVVNQTDLGWSESSERELSLKKGEGYIIKAYVKGVNGKESGGSDQCVLKVNGKVQNQPETGIPTEWLLVGLVILPLVGWRLVILSKNL